MIWYDMIWYDMAIMIMIWYDIIWYDVVRYDMIWYDIILYYMVWWCGTIRYDMIWYDMVWYGMIWYAFGARRITQIKHDHNRPHWGATGLVGAIPALPESCECDILDSTWHNSGRVMVFRHPLGGSKLLGLWLKRLPKFLSCVINVYHHGPSSFPLIFP